MRTIWGERLKESSILPEYPRPQLKRNSFLNLNGEWDFEVSNYDYIPSKFNMNIMVPYPVESKLSGVGKHFKKGSRLFYRRFSV